MKEKLKNNLIIHAIWILLVIASCGHSHDDAASQDTYICPMHPTVISDRPSTCPVCGMDLVRKARPGEEVEITEDLARLLKSPNEVVVDEVKTIRGQYRSLPSSIRAVGTVTYDTRNTYNIPARVGGRLEKVYLQSEFEKVSKGQAVAEIYSPELVTAQRELIFLVNNDAGNSSLIDAAKRKLSLLGMTERQINNVIKIKEAATTVTVYSPYDGFVIYESATTSASVDATTSAATSSGASGMSGMGGAATANPGFSTRSNPTPQAGFVREGDYVTAGQALFQIAGTTSLRIEMNFPATANIKKGAEISWKDGGEVNKGKIDLVQPFYSDGENFITVRIFPNKPEGLQVGQLIEGEIEVATSEALWVPRSAVVDMGTREVVFIKERGVLKPKLVQTGTRSNGMIQITGGLASSDDIAANAEFLVDSESFIKKLN